MGLTEKEIRQLCDRVLGISRADGVSVSVGSASQMNARFANNDVTTNGVVDSIRIYITVNFGMRSATVSVNQADKGSLRQAVDNAEAMAKLAPENPELMPPLGPAEFDPPIHFSENTDAAGPADLLKWLRPVVEHSRSSGVSSAGFLAKNVRRSALATSEGLFVQQPSSGCSFTMTARTAEGRGSGWASTQVTDTSQLDLETPGKRAVKKALDSRNATEMKPGRRTVLLESAAARDLLSLLAWNLDRRDFDEKRSFLNALSPDGDPVNQSLFGSRATLFSDPLFEAAPCATHAGGLPLKRTSWVKDGVLENLHVGRFWAKKNGIDPLPGPQNLIMPGDGKSMEDLVASIDDGVLVTRLWYIRAVQPQTLLYTGLTRDGTFRIVDGAIAGPVKNFRFNETPVNLLRNLEATGIPERSVGGESGMPAHIPPLVVSDFNFSSVSDAS